MRHFHIYNSVQDDMSSVWFVPMGEETVYRFEHFSKKIEKVYDFSGISETYSGKYNLIFYKDSLYCIDRKKVEIIKINLKTGDKEVFSKRNSNRDNWYSVLYDDYIYIFPLELNNDVIYFSIIDHAFYTLNFSGFSSKSRSNQYDQYNSIVYFIDDNSVLYTICLKTQNITKNQLKFTVRAMAVYDSNSILCITADSELILYNISGGSFQLLRKLNDSGRFERIIRVDELYFLVSDYGIYLYDGKYINELVKRNMKEITGSKYLSVTKIYKDYYLWPFFGEYLIIYHSDENNVEEYLMYDSDSVLFETEIGLSDFVKMI